VVLIFLSTMATMFIILRSRSRHNQDNFNIQLDNAPFERTYTEPAQPVQPAPAIWKS
jgi:hypothetical protein